MIYKEILERLKQARKQAGLSQSQVGVMIGLAAASFSDIERGENPLSVERLLELVEIYDISIEWLMTGVNPYFDPQVALDHAERLGDDAAKIIELFSSLKGKP